MIQKSPFKFLDSFTKEDREIFFGRDREIEELHSRVFESKILLVYGTSGTGKSSLINCGLANKFSDSDWLPVNIRRGTDINRSLLDALAKAAITRTPFEKAVIQGSNYSLEKLLRSIYLDHFKPIFLIFDQFEELFIFGSKDEKNELIKNVAEIVDSGIQCRFIFSMREEYLAGVTEFEKVIPTFLSNRIRIEKMTRQNAIQTIEGPCRVNNIEVEEGFAEALLEKLNPDTSEVELTWLQIYLDKILRLAVKNDQLIGGFSIDHLKRAGEVKDILGSFLDEQISQLDDPETGLVVLKSFVSVKGTKHQITGQEVIEYSKTFGKRIDSEVIKELIQKFIRLRILRDKDENERYELRHDSLALKIFEKITLVEKELLEVKYFIENAYVNYEKRHLLLSGEDLSYIAPYEDKLFLNDRHHRFLLLSKQALQKAKKRRQNIIIAAASVLFIVLSFFTVWAMRERNNAIRLRVIAVNQKNAADREKMLADSASIEAIKARQKAVENEEMAIRAMNQSETARKEAIAARQAADLQRNRAEQLSVIANDQARKAELERQKADTQRILAQSAEEKARRLSMLATARTLAMRTMSQDFKPQAKGLVAVQAYIFNKNYGGSLNDPVIYKALLNAYNTLDSSRHSVIANPFGYGNEVRNLVEIQNGIMGTDLDGNFVLLYSDSRDAFTWFNKTQPDYIDFISLSPGGSNTFIGYENKKLVLQRITFSPSFTVSDTELHGHSGSVKAAAWSSDGKYLVTGGRDSLIVLWDIGSTPAASVKTIKANSGVKALAFCNSDSVISAHDDGSIILWNMTGSTRELLFPSGTELPLAIAWNKVKKTLVAGSSDGQLLLIDLNKKPYRSSRFAAHSSGIDQMVFNSDYTLLATGSWDKIIRLYNYNQFFEMSNSVGGSVSFENLGARARSLMLTSDNKLIAGMSDKSIRIWETSSERLVSLICGEVKRDMTLSEWVDIVGKDIPYEKTCGNEL